MSILLEGPSYRVNLFGHFVEAKIPQSCLHSQAGQALGQCILEEIASQLYLPGTRIETLQVEV